MSKNNSNADQKNAPILMPSSKALMCSADASETLRCLIEPVANATPVKLDALSSLLAANQWQREKPYPGTCQLILRIAFFFDGTGNNREADEATDEHSNVARLFKAHPLTKAQEGLYAFYIPGLGTYFKDVGDPGTDSKGAAFGSFGEKRLAHAMKQLEDTIAFHGASKIAEIRIALFGFSRGAALARAFANRIYAHCKYGTKGYHWGSINKPCSIYFMGLFDTVASVGLPASTSDLSYEIASKSLTLDEGLARRRKGYLQTGLDNIAFGAQPGADPTQAVYDGHMSWGNELAIPPIVSNVRHILAMNEMRNSFPADTVAMSRALPPGAYEMVCPGVHSDVGGGYRPGEGGKSVRAELMLSKIPLRQIYDYACAAGVPLLSLDNPLIKRDFIYEQALADRYNAVIATAGRSHATLGAAILAYTKLGFRARFFSLRRRMKAHKNRETTPYEKMVAAQEEQFAREAREQQARLKVLQDRFHAAKNEEDAAYLEWTRNASVSPFMPNTEDLKAYESAKARTAQAEEAYLRELAKYNTLPTHQGELLAALEVYDRNLLQDVETLKQLAKDGRKMRPHYAALLQAYDDEFIHNRGLDAERDKLVIEFFENFVHDSLAGFAKDATLPSDPRCYYIGGDDELKYANNEPVLTGDDVQQVA